VYPRYVEESVREALADTPVVSLNGPRQSGKTTLARKLAGKDWDYLTLDDASVLESATTDPAGFIRGLDRAVIDEIQRAPDLLLAIKRSVDEDRRPGRFLLTGSAHILTIPKVRESLAGRMEVVTLYPLSHAEVLGSGAPTFLGRALQGEPPQVGEKIIGDELMEVVLAGGYPDALSRSSEKRRRGWFLSFPASLPIFPKFRGGLISIIRLLIATSLFWSIFSSFSDFALGSGTNSNAW
jgi:predicted AAA+ superfamily ATPase